MKLLFDFFPIIFFFIAYKLFNIYVATAVAIISAFIQVITHRIVYQRFDTMQLVGLAIIAMLGGATLYFHSETFIKWKPTGIYWVTALFLLFSHRLMGKPLLQKVLDGNMSLPAHIWSKLNLAWAVFFLFMGGLNIVIATQFSTDTWVYFKLVGGAGLTLFFVLVQSIYLSKHLIRNDIERQATSD